VINDKVVKSLCSQLLKEEDCTVKEVVAAAIGGIGLPEAQIAVDALVKTLQNTTTGGKVK
jgi:hypothetical protein